MSWVLALSEIGVVVCMLIFIIFHYEWKTRSKGSVVLGCSRTRDSDSFMWKRVNVHPIKIPSNNWNKILKWFSAPHKKQDANDKVKHVIKRLESNWEYEASVIRCSFANCVQINVTFINFYLFYCLVNSDLWVTLSRILFFSLLLCVFCWTKRHKPPFNHSVRSSRILIEFLFLSIPNFVVVVVIRQVLKFVYLYLKS